MVGHIYVLVDTASPSQVRYVGQTCQPKERLIQHESEARGFGQTHKLNWIRSVHASGRGIDLIVVGSAEVGSSLDALEVAVINRYRVDGHLLTNGVERGRGADRNPFSVTHRSNLSRSLRGRKLSEEHRKNIGLARRGRKLGPLTAEQKTRLAAQRRSPEYRAKLSEGSRRRWSRQSERDKQSIAQLARYAAAREAD